MNSFSENHMNMSSQTRKQLPLQGPRPEPLTVIKKRPFPGRSRSPVIIYLQSPKVIHVRPEEFMDTVQRLTGNQAASVPAMVLADANMGHGISADDQDQQKFCSRVRRIWC